MNETRSTTQINVLRAVLLLCGFVMLTGAKGGCFYAGPDAVYYETYEPADTVYYHPSDMQEEIVVEEEVIIVSQNPSTNVVVTQSSSYSSPAYYGDIAMTYDFGPYDCWDMDIETFDIALVDEYGDLILTDYGIPCDIYSEIQLLDIPMGDYYFTLIGHNFWGDETYFADIPIEHWDIITILHLFL